MPEKVYVSDLVDDQFVQSTFLVDEKEMRETRAGDPYLRVALSDRTGTVEGRIWDQVETLAGRFEADEFVGVRGTVDTWNGELQLKIDDIQTVDEDEVEVREYLPYSRWSSDEMFDELRELVDDHVRSGAVRRFLETLLTDEEFVEKFKEAPAATSNHHDYFGGLLEHTLSMTRIGVSLSNHYARYYPGFLNQDLVIAGCILHDAGKVDELSYDRSVSYSTEGKLVGHIAQGVELVTATADAMQSPPPEELVSQLKHLVLSHHGHREFGAPVEPRTPEAMLLHEIDMIDSGMNQFHGHVEQHREGRQSDEDWTSYHRSLETDIYAGPESTPDWAAPLDPELDASSGPGAPEPGDTGSSDAGSGDSGDDSKTMDLFDD